MHSRVYKTFFVFALIVSALAPSSARADTLLVSPASGSYQVGQTFSVRIMISSPQAVNAVSAILSFPTNKLQVTSLSKIGSILNLWVEEPSFSNSQGTVSLEGVVPNPGYTGSGGPVVTVNFRVLETGTANLQFSSGSLLANDGYGTNILKNRRTASFNLVPKAAVAEPPAEEATPVEETYLDLSQTQTTEPKVVTPQEQVIAVEIPSLASILGFLMKFFSVVIPLLALVFFLIHTTKRGVGNIRTLRKNLRKDLHSVDRLVEKSFDLMKEDISESIHILERARTKRRLTAEEDAIIHRLRQNLVDAEKIIHEEVSHAEKDLGD